MLRIGDTGRAIFFQFILFTKKLENIIFTKIQILQEISQGIQIFDQNVNMSCGS